MEIWHLLLTIFIINAVIFYGNEMFPVPGTSGLVLPDENLGKVQNQGVDFNIDYRRNFKDFFGWV